MSRLLIQNYHSEIEKIIRFGGSRKETSIRGAFQNLLNDYCKQKDFLLIPELDFKLPNGKTVYPDGTVKNALRLTWGYWESKDEADDLDEEIQKKFAKGYPQDNILFEDSHRAVLIQAGAETLRVTLDDIDAADQLLQQFLHYERPEVRTFRQAIERFKLDLPQVVQSLRNSMDAAETVNASFQHALRAFVGMGQQSINPEFGPTEAREMMIQHILTEDIFNRIFDETQFHRENNIARELERVIHTFFTGSTRRDTLERIRPYFDVINAQAAGIASHKEKQKFLKVVYENFYQAYNPKIADKLGIVYTPNEVVRFMIESTECLTEKHFGKLLGDKGVEILDPATGTGTFITELLDYLPKNTLEHKYKHELFANEIAILPYYIANLNIEYTYKQRTGQYQEFDNICFVDTLDNVGFQKTRRGQLGLSFGLGMENSARIKRQNEREISVIIGNPPYNANQQNENNNNKNRTYASVDKRIKDTYLLRSTAQKTAVYDMYARFFRWASDRLSDRGILTFITNSSFIHSRTFDGFRKVVADEFSDIYLVDLGGDVRANPKLSGTKHNVFGIQTGVAIGFFIKQPKRKGQLAKIHYLDRPAMETAASKLTFLHENKFDTLDFERIKPNAKGNWLGQTNNDWESLVPLINKETKVAKHLAGENALFGKYSTGYMSGKDEWVVDFSKESLLQKVELFASVYAQHTAASKVFDTTIKWSRNLKGKLANGETLTIVEKEVVKTLYRPFVSKLIYNSDLLVDEKGAFKKRMPNQVFLCCSGIGSSKPFQALTSLEMVSYDTLEKTQCIPLYFYNKEANRQSNITAWGLAQFRSHYGDAGLTGKDIFHYAYAVLHDPHYRERYKINLKQDFPRLPFYPDFQAWAQAGEQLLVLHLSYETANSWPIERHENESPEKGVKTRLKAEPAAGTIILDDTLTLSGIPALAWDYKLGNRSALEWVLDQYKGKKPKDPTIRGQFNTYRFANHREEVVELLAKVCTVSVQTQAIVNELAALSPLKAKK